MKDPTNALRDHWALAVNRYRERPLARRAHSFKHETLATISVKWDENGLMQEAAEAALEEKGR